jgi:hypothetical protein
VRCRNSAALLLAVTACGGSGTDHGSGTLRVTGEVECYPLTENAQTESELRTDFFVLVEKDGESLGDRPTVVAYRDGVALPLFWDSTNRGGRWSGDPTGYITQFELEITYGDDHVERFALAGPDLHVITAPDPGVPVDPTAPVTVTWSGEVEAEGAWIQSSMMDRAPVPDTGSFDIPVGGLRAEMDTIRVGRWTDLAIDGAADGSELYLEVENTLPVTVAAAAD